MNPLKRYVYDPLRRYRRGKGFGIHSPHAFNLVMNVLGEREAYYAYAPLRKMHHLLEKKEETLAAELPTFAEAALLFRLVNHFMPEHIVEVGSGHGLLEAACLLVNSQSTLSVVGNVGSSDLAGRMLKPFDGRITDYRFATAPQFAVINNSQDLLNTTPLISRVVDAEGVVVFRNINRIAANRQLWEKTLESMTYGQTFTNDRTGIIVANPKLPLQHFSLKF